MILFLSSLNQKRKSFFFCLLISSAVVCSAQQTAVYTEPERHYKKALSLFDHEKYSAAQRYFEQVLELPGVAEETRTSAQYYAALSAIELFHRNGEYLMKKFMEEHPESPRISQAQFHLGRHFYRQKRFQPAAEWLSRVDTYYLTEEEKAEYWFKLGYSYFNFGDLANASRAFHEIKDKENKYSPAASYYYSHIAYENGNYETALKGFLKLRDSENFGPVVPYYIIQIYHYQNRYDELLAYAVPMLDSIQPKNTSEISRLVGNAYYRRSDYPKAIRYLEEYQKNAAKTFREDYFQLGFSHYQTGNYKKAVSWFEKAVQDNDSVSQNAFYHMGDCYLRTGNKLQARNSFFFASRLSFDEEIQEDALFNYAKLCYEMSYQPDAVNALQQYIRDYPSSARTDEANEYLAQLFMITRNYKDALVAIEKIKSKKDKVKTAYQRICYFRGVELYNGGFWLNAIQHFDKAIGNPSDPKLLASSLYWRAEALFQLKSYDLAIKSYNDFIYTPSAVNLPMYNTANYNMGYCYFKKQDYSTAQTWFRKYIRNKPETTKPRYDDALLRVADAFFVERDYYNAADFYDEAVRAGATESDYALYQLGIIQGINNKLTEKVATMQMLITRYPSSTYVDDAMYEAGAALLLKGDNQGALKYFTDITTRFPGSGLVSKAMLSTATAYYREKEDEKAVDQYKKVVASFPCSEVASSAMLGIKNIYVNSGDADAYIEYVKNVPCASVTSGSQDSILYEAAEKKYLKGDCNGAAKDFGSYLQKFPSGFFTLHANFYKAECEFNNKKLAAALAGYHYVVTSPRSMFTEKALVRASEIYFGQKQYEKALETFVRLQEIAEYKDNLFLAYAGQMRCHFLLGNFPASVLYAQRIIGADKTPERLLAEARLTFGKSAIKTDSLDAAIKELSLVARQNSETGAEAKYNLALARFLKKDHEGSEKNLNELINQDPSYDYWVAKGFILLADNYAARKDIFQAKHTLQSIIDGYERESSDPDDVVAMAKEKLALLIQQEEEQKRIEQLEKEKLLQLQQQNDSIQAPKND